MSEHVSTVVQIRRASLEDAEAIASVLYESFAEHESSYTPEGFALTVSTPEQVRDRLKAEHVWVALVDEGIVGTVGATPKGEALYVRSMAVLPASRGCRVGHRLMECVEEFAVSEGFKHMFLSTTPFLTRAIKLYERCGFRRSPEGPHDLRGTPLFTMVKQVRAMHKIERLSEEQARPMLPQLAALLQDAVHSGSSVGFLPPLTFETAEGYWLETLNEVAQGKRILLVSSEAGDVTGAVQLALVAKQNGLHRAEVQKLLVNTRFRQRGIARALMGAAEESARASGRTLLVLDTEQGSVAEKLYEKCGYARAGVIPQYALNADRSLISTVVFYKLL